MKQRQFTDSAEPRLQPRLLAAPHARVLLNELNFALFDAKLEQRLAQVKSDLVKWMFIFWAPTALGVVSLLLRR